MILIDEILIDEYLQDERSGIKRRGSVGRYVTLGRLSIYIYIYEEIQGTRVASMLAQKRTYRSVGTSVGTIYQPLRSGRIWHKVNF